MGDFYFLFFKQIDTTLLSGSTAYVQTGNGRTEHKVKMGGVDLQL